MTTYSEAYLLAEDGCYLLLESGGRIILEESLLKSEFVGETRFNSRTYDADFSSDSALTTIRTIT